MASQRSPGELRINPEDGEAYTLDKLLELYRSQFDESTIQEFWGDMEPARAEAGSGNGARGWAEEDEPRIRMEPAHAEAGSVDDAREWAEGDEARSRRGSRSRSRQRPFENSRVAMGKQDARGWSSSSSKGKGKHEGASSSGHASMARLVNEAQKKSQSFGKAWHEYCTAFGGGTFNPILQSEDFIRDFLEYSADCVVRDMEYTSAKGSGKRASMNTGFLPNMYPTQPPEMWMGYNPGYNQSMAAQFFGPPTGPGSRQPFYGDYNGAGPSAPGGGAFGKPFFEGGGRTDMMAKGKGKGKPRFISDERGSDDAFSNDFSQQPPPIRTQGLAAEGGMEVPTSSRRRGPVPGPGSKEELVFKVKDWQRLGEKQKRQWWDFADSRYSEATGRERTKDPARFSEEALLDFLALIE